LTKAEVFYFSYTGTCKKIAKFLGTELNLPVKEIKPPKLPYLAWLALSFIPGLPIPSKALLPQSENLILVFPKWTINCPPITYFYFLCKKRGVKLKKILLVVSYGGFREEPYAKHYVRKFKDLSDEIKLFLIKRKETEEKLPSLREWIKKNLEI
jgi:flavodoxin